MSIWNFRTYAVSAATVLAVSACCLPTLQAQSYPQNYGAGASTNSQQPIIQIQHHHHHYYYQPAGLDPLKAQEADPATAAGPGYLGARPSFGAEPMPEGGSWGGLGLYGYPGQLGNQSGLIVNRVAPNGPASQLGLIAGDVILEINGQDVNDLTIRQLQTLFVSLTTEAEQEVTMQVWNSHTGRTSTLRDEFENRQVGSFDREDEP